MYIIQGYTLYFNLLLALCSTCSARACSHSSSPKLPGHPCPWNSTQQPTDCGKYTTSRCWAPGTSSTRLEILGIYASCIIYYTLPSVSLYNRDIMVAGLVMRVQLKRCNLPKSHCERDTAEQQNSQVEVNMIVTHMLQFVTIYQRLKNCGKYG